MEIVLIFGLIFSFGFAAYKYGRIVEKNEEFKKQASTIQKVAEAHNSLNDDELVERLHDEFRRWFLRRL